MLVCIQHLQTDFFPAWNDERDYQALHFDVSLVTWAFIQGHSFIRDQKLLCPFYQKFHSQFGWNSVCCHNLLHGEICTRFYFVHVIFMGDNSADVILETAFNIIPCQDTCEPICFKLGMMLDMTESTVWIQFKWPWCSVKVTGLWKC